MALTPRPPRRLRRRRGDCPGDRHRGDAQRRRMGSSGWPKRRTVGCAPRMATPLVDPRGSVVRRGGQLVRCCRV